ncbi:hypothetical protein [Sphingopyxis macrogoltabida]|uniref:CHAT domain-containing protein n=1 Tax=Sphingopyxis macrogoltabida TaxID=33050 RepID=A0AAC9AXJ2_SPHMC|nr:hypothetical protein [Sphingopyxis macrogoltabida]ALJ15312.1 hypothetical protein LH19_20750 [Sphingopyxis macrogoltabida]AMU91554.1 hypothetical protein ATM17_21285 [Sphingopyxis macrogoltabida]
MNWHDWIALTPETFIKRLRRRLTKPIGHNDFIALYNVLMAATDERVEWVLVLAPRLNALLKKRKRPREALLFLEMTARAQIIAGKAMEAFETLNELARADSSSETRETVLELTRGLVGHSEDYAASLDHRPAMLKAACTLLAHYELWEERGELLLEAAHIYSRHGAVQAAYRAIDDVERLAHDIGSLPLLARAFQAAVAVACDEGDPEFAVHAGHRAIETLDEIGKPAPVSLLCNMGTAMMRMGDTSNGEIQLRRALAASGPDSEIRPSIMVNLAACLRQAGKLNDAKAVITDARTAHDADSKPESVLELELISARIGVEAGEASTVVKALSAAAEAFDLALADVLRLHHRRGLRERYLPRFETILRSLPENGPAHYALAPLIACRGNALGDWMALLRWRQEVVAGASPEMAQAIESIVDGLRREGAPHLFGFLEKYDDAWEPGNLVGEFWDRLSRIVPELNERFGNPFADARLTPMLEAIHERLTEGHCIVAMTYAGEEPMLWAFHGNQYSRVQLPATPLQDWLSATIKFSNGEQSRRDFAHALASLLDILSPLLDPLWEHVAYSGAQSVRYLQDFSPAPPIGALVMRNCGLRDRMRKGEFEVRIVAALRQADEAEAVHGPIVAIIDKDGDLLLPRHEGVALARAAGLQEPTVVDVSEQRDLPEVMGRADMMLVSTHGAPISGFTDPFFAKLGGSKQHPISISSLQAHGDRLNVRVVILNACYSGSGSAKNFQRQFRTSDMVSYPAFSLLNGRTIACAGGWRTSDTAGFLFTWLVGKALGAGLGPAAAMSSAIGSLPEMTRDEAIAALEEIDDPVDRQAAIERLDQAPASGPFSHPYLSGALTIHGLL